MLTRAALTFGAAAALFTVPAAAQSARDDASPLAGRWALTLEGGAPPRVRGELRLHDSSGTLAGTILLETRDSAPVPLQELRAEGARIEFLAPLDPGMRFVGQVQANGLAGEAFGGAGEQMQTWRATRLAEAIEFYPALPRFRLRQIIAGLPDSVVRLPGAWLAAAERAGLIADSLEPAYQRAARAAGVAPLPGAALPADGGPYLLGVYRREETGPALAAALARIHADLATPALRTAFARLFSARDGRWLPDVHAVALDRARHRVQALEWAQARPALVAAGWIPGDASEDAGTLPYAVYRLAHLQAVDTVQFRLVGERMAAGAPVSARAVGLLLDGYRDALAWYPEAIGFLLTAPWVLGADGAAPRSIADLMGEVWTTAPGVPELRAAYFGYPQAVPRYGTPAALVDRLLVPENWTARTWLQRNGQTRLLTVVQRLGVDSLVPTTLERGGRTLRLSTVRRQASENINGFLETGDAIVADPGVPPLLALGTVVHEWHHLAFERARWAASPEAQPAAFDSTAGTVTLRPPEPVIAEGVAEWGTEVVMASLVTRHPIVGMAEPLKRARLARMAPDDPHLTGYLLARALATVLPPHATAAALVDAATDPARVLGNPAAARAWRAVARAPDVTVPRSGGLVLVPETRFTIESGWPDPVESRIRF
jgi:hypothetical protein